jgi:hypothetical protein
MAQLQVHKVFGALPGTPVDNSVYFVKTLQNDLRIFVTESSGNVAREIVVGGQVDSIQPGDNITVDNTDPTSPIISVNGLTSDDIGNDTIIPGANFTAAFDTFVNATNLALVAVQNETDGSVTIHSDVIDAGSGEIITTTERNKLNGIEVNATANDTDVNLRNRATHTGTQAASTISDFDTEVSNNPNVTANTAKISYTDAVAVAANTAKVSADGSVTTHNDVTDAGSGAIITAAERSKVGAIPAGGTTGQVLAKIDGTDYNTEWASVGGGGGIKLDEEVFQPTHGFTVGTVLKPSTTTNGWYEEAQADSAANAEVVGIVSEVVDVDTYKIQIGGNLTSGVPSGSHGDVVFLSPTVAGGTTTTKPSTNGQVIKPIGVLTGDPLQLRMFDYIGTVIDDGIAPTSQKDKSFTIESPTALEDITLWRTNADITITGIHTVSLGTTPSVTYTIRFASDRSATGTEVVTSGSTTTSTTMGDTVSSFDDATIPAGSWIWIETTAQTGTVDQISFTINYDE